MVSVELSVLSDVCEGLVDENMTCDEDCMSAAVGDSMSASNFFIAQPSSESDILLKTYTKSKQSSNNYMRYVAFKYNKNSSEDEIANVNVLRRHRTCRGQGIAH